MQGKLLVFNVIMALIILNVVAENDVEDSDEDSDEDDGFELYKTNLVNAIETLRNNFENRDVSTLERRNWFNKVWHETIEPELGRRKYRVGWKRTFNDNETLKRETRELNLTQCVKDAAQFKEVKRAASQLCALADIPDLKCQ